MRPEGAARQLQARRTRAVALLKHGHSYQAVARMVQSSLSSVVRWMQSFRRKGKAGLKPRPMPGRPPEMKPRHRKKLIALPKAGARAAGYSTEMWTARRVAEQIRRHWGIEYHPGPVWKVLVRLGWSGQKPERRALQRNERKIRQWNQTPWPRIKKARALRAHLVCLDEGGFLLIPPGQRTWAPRGRTPVLRHSYRRDRLSAIGGRTMSPKRHRLGLYFQIHPWNATAVEMVQYFTELPRHLRGEVIVPPDGWAVHKDRKGAPFCRRHGRLPLERFPAYAPELNPEEYVWTQSKRGSSNPSPQNRGDLLDLVVGAPCDVQQSQTLLGACLAQAAKHGLVWNN